MWIERIIIMKKHKKLAGLQKRKAISGYLFISPFIIGFLMFMLVPLFRSLYMSFCEVIFRPAGGGNDYNFLGLTNYIRAFTVDLDFNRLLVEEITQMFYNSLAVMVFSFFVALILNQKFKGRALVRAVFFLPVILSSGVLLGIETDNQLISSVMDMVEESNTNANISIAIQEILRTAGVGTRAFQQVFDIVDGIYDVAISSGIQIIIFLSGLQTISESMYEAASIEGCTSWESLWKITFPMVSPLLLVNWIYSIVDYCMRNNNQIITKINDQMILFMDYGFASAIAWTYFLVVILIIGVTSFLISKGVYYYD